MFISVKYRHIYFPNYIYILLPPLFVPEHNVRRRILQCTFFIVRKTWEPPWSPNFISNPISSPFAKVVKGDHYVLFWGYPYFIFLLYILTNNQSHTQVLPIFLNIYKNVSFVPLALKRVTRFVFFTIVGIKFGFCGKTCTALFMNPEEGHMEFPQNSNKYKKAGYHNPEDQKK